MNEEGSDSVLIVFVILLIPVGVIYVLNEGNPYTKLIMNKYIPVYLEKSGYTQEELKEAHYVEQKHLINKDFYHGHYMVVFKDEPSTTYYYGVTKKGKEVFQFCEKDSYSPSFDMYTNTKHSEENCLKSLDNR